MSRRPSLTLALKDALNEKAARRRKLAKQPYLKKVEQMLRLQRIENEVRRATKRPLRPEWPL